MPGFLISSKDNCNCCPEMRCCPPETVFASVSGMAGQIYRPTVPISDIKNTVYFDIGQGVDTRNTLFYSSKFFECEEACQDRINTTGDTSKSLADFLVSQGKPTGSIQDIGPSCRFFRSGGWIGANFDSNPWPPSFFPPTTPKYKLPLGYGRDIEDSICVNNNPNIPIGSWFCTGMGGFAIITSYATQDSRCDPLAMPPGHPLFCTRPGDGPFQAGPANNRFAPTYLVVQSDLNGLYVCKRPDQFVRPQLKATITRQNELENPSEYPGVTDATLLYNVAEHRTWVELGPPWDCTDILFPNDGDKFVVDYRCGKRNPWYAWEGGEICFRGKCIGAAQGVVKPHLWYYHQWLNQSADLYIRLGPKEYEDNDDGRFPTDWQVIGIDIRDGGSGYAEGEFLFIDFDLRRDFLGGERMSVFPEFEFSCFLPTYLTWTDKYGYSGLPETLPNGIPARRIFQRIRISRVDDDGAIKEVEVVPIYKSPEYSDPPLCLNERKGAARTEFYVGYGRVLCHPRSVHFPGIGYTVGDTIEWHCDETDCDEIAAATAVVTDVDEEGGILDWRIRGSDFPGVYATENVCDEVGEGGTRPGPTPECLALCSDRQPNVPPAQDERGHYEWKAKVLCDLTWEGVGVPARKVGSLLGSLPTCNYGQNESSYTNIRMQITRQTCETSIEVVVNEWPHGRLIENSTGAYERIRRLFPPYPACGGGGAMIRPVFGPPGGNESDFGGPLVGAVVEGRGGGYCYRDKAHTVPTLPLKVPAIGGGAGAWLAGVEFDAVHEFPNPNFPEEAWSGPAPSPSRFSYFPVVAAEIDPERKGEGYEVGQEFEVKPAGGFQVSDMWKVTGGDHPDTCPNGAWYGGDRALLNADGYISLLYNGSLGSYGEPVSTRHSTCKLRISQVNDEGGIERLDVVEGGMMFKTVLTGGVKNPDAVVVINSTLGYGASTEAEFEESFASEDFGKLMSVSIVSLPPGSQDPKHPDQPMPTGGRDYADPSAGYFWMLQNINVGSPVLTGAESWSLQAYLGWHNHGMNSPYNYAHLEYSTHDVLQGSMPTFVPMSSVCSFSDCYHSLLNRTYPLVKVWGAGGPGPGTNGGFYGAPFGWGNRDGTPNTGYALLLKKNPARFSFLNINEPWSDQYVVVEHGPTLSLSSTPGECSDLHDGTPYRR